MAIKVVYICEGEVKMVRSVELFDTPSQSDGMLLAKWDHTVLPATQHKWTHPALTPPEASTRFTYCEGRKAELT